MARVGVGLAMILREQGIVMSKTRYETTRDAIPQLWPTGTPLDMEAEKYYQ
jgi:hypothetical protein